MALVQFAAGPRTHILINGRGRYLCGNPVDQRDVYEDPAHGQAIWDEFPSDRCRMCEASVNSRSKRAVMARGP